MDEKATSSSRKGAIPVHSESRQPRTSSSSASSSSACVLTGLLVGAGHAPPLHPRRGRAPRASRRAGTAGPPAPAGRLPRSRRFSEDRAPYPCRLLAREAAEAEALLALWAVVRHDPLELVPVGLGEVPAAGRLVLAQRGIRHGQAEF